MPTDPAGGNRGAFRLLLDYALRDRPLLARTLGLLLLATGFDVTGPVLAKVYIDGFLLPGDFRCAPLAGLLAGYLATQVLSAWLRYQQTLRFTDMALTAVLDIRRRVFRHVLRLPVAYFDHARTGQLVSRITNDTEAIKDLYVQFLSVVLTNAVLLVSILAAMALLDPRLMLVALLLVPAVAGVIYLYQRLSGAAVADARQLRAQINADLNESIAGMTVIQACNQQARFRQRFETVNRDYYRARIRTVRAGGALLRPAIDLLSILALTGVVWGFGRQVQGGTAEVGVLYAFLAYLSRFTEPLAEVTQRFNLYQQAMVAAGRLQQLLLTAEQPYRPDRLDIDRGAIEIRHLRFHYQADKPVLKGLEAAIPAGAFYAVVGPTGGGKSTLLSLLLAFYRPVAGEIRIDGRPLDDYGHDGLRRGIGLIPQEPFVLAASVRDNIDLGRGLPAAAIERAARQAHLHAVIEALPQGYDTPLGERGTRLSTGQRQQLIIARALAASPRILLLDEATANVDSETEQVVQRALQELRGRVTLIVVAHRLSTIQHADRILVLAHGELVEQGDHRQLMQRPDGLYRSLYQLQRQARLVEAAAP